MISKQLILDPSNLTLESNVKSSILLTMLDFTFKLKFLARENKKLIKALMLLTVVDELYDWSNWFNDDQSKQLCLQNLRYKIIRDNNEIINYRKQTNTFYSNVNTPQTNTTWTRVYDDNSVITISDLQNVITPPYVYPYFYGIHFNEKPIRNQDLINSGTQVFQDSSQSITIPFNSPLGNYLWFAIPATSTSKTGWMVDNDNAGSIGGPYDLFSQEITLNINIPNSLQKNIPYKIYVSNYATEVQTLTVLN